MAMMLLLMQLIRIRMPLIVTVVIGTTVFCQNAVESFAFVADTGRQQQQRQRQRQRKLRLSQTKLVEPSADIGKGQSGNNHPHPIGLYIHIPYCRQRCRYCNFAIVPIGNRIRTDKVVHEKNEGDHRAFMGFYDMNEKYIDALLTELDWVRRRQQQRQQRGQRQEENNDNDTKIPLQSIYFGGGTPSLASVETISTILHSVLGNDNDKNNSPIFVLEPDAEITMEMDPGTFDENKLRAFKDVGINRISLGVQSFDDTILELMGRTHRVQDVENAIQCIARVYGDNPSSSDGDDDDINDDDEKDKKSIYDDDDDDIIETKHDHCNVNYSIDLISGVPGLTLAKWVETLQRATSLSPRPSHLSIYDLQIEKGTVFSTWYDDTRSDIMSATTMTTIPSKTTSSPSDNPLATSTNFGLPTEEECASMYKYAAGYLRAKQYEHYEVSSYAYCGMKTKSDNGGNTNDEKNMNNVGGSSMRSRHNQIYWSMSSSWYAIGLGATSFIDGKLESRPKQFADYLEWVKQKNTTNHNNDHLSNNTNKTKTDDNHDGDGDGHDDDDYDKTDYLTDVVMKRLRTSDGLNLRWIRDEYGSKVLNSIRSGANLGIELGLAEIISNEANGRNNKNNDDDYDDVLRLKDPDGFLYSNYIISSIFAELDDENDLNKKLNFEN